MMKHAFRRYGRGLGVVACAVAMSLQLGCSNAPYPPQAEGEKVLYTSIHIDPRQGLDPVAVTDTLSAGLVGQLYDALYEYHYLKRPYEIQPALAADLPSVATDGLTVTIPIKRGIYFIDDPCFPDGKGREVVAQDFVYALKRMADINSGSHNFWLIEGRIVGLDDLHARSQEIAAGSRDMDDKTFNAAIGALYDDDVLGLEAVDRYTLVIRLNTPFPQLRYVLAMCNAAAQAREAVEYYGCHAGRRTASGHENDYFKNPVGTGPFMLPKGGWREQQHIIMVRNPGYREDLYPSQGEPGDEEMGLLEYAGRQMPFVDSIRYSIIRESQPNWIFFRQGYLDGSGIPRDNFNEAITTDLELAPEFIERGISLIRSEELVLFWKMFNMTDPEFGDGPRDDEGNYLLDANTRARNRLVRRAVSMAFDRERIIRVFLNGRGELGRGPVPKGMYGYDAQVDNPNLVHNPSAARALLEQAGYPDGRKPDGTRLKLTYDLQGNDPMLRQMARSFVTNMDAIGIEVEVRTNTWPEYLRRTREGRFQMADAGWQLDYPDPENFLQLLYGPNRPPKSNSAAYWNLEYDELYDRMRDMEDTPERLAIIRRMSEILADEMPWIVGHSRVSFILTPPWSKNFTPHNISGGYAKYRDIDVELRNRLRQEWNQPRYDVLAVVALAVVVGGAALAYIKAPGRA